MVVARYRMVAADMERSLWTLSIGATGCVMRNADFSRGIAPKLELAPACLRISGLLREGQGQLRS